MAGRIAPIIYGSRSERIKVFGCEAHKSQRGIGYSTNPPLETLIGLPRKHDVSDLWINVVNAHFFEFPNGPIDPSCIRAEVRADAPLYVGSNLCREVGRHVKVALFEVKDKGRLHDANFDDEQVVVVVV